MGMSVRATWWFVFVHVLQRCFVRLLFANTSSKVGEGTVPILLQVHICGGVSRDAVLVVAVGVRVVSGMRSLPELCSSGRNVTSVGSRESLPCVGCFGPLVSRGCGVSVCFSHVWRMRGVCPQAGFSVAFSSPNWLAVAH